MGVCLYQKSVCKFTVPKVCTVGIYSTYESRYLYSLEEYIVNCLLKNKFNISCSILFLYLSQHYKPNVHVKNITWLKFTINFSLFKHNYNWQHCSAISLTVIMLCVCTKRVYWSAKQCDWLFHIRPAPFPFPLFLFPGL